MSLEYIIADLSKIVKPEVIKAILILGIGDVMMANKLTPQSTIDDLMNILTK